MKTTHELAEELMRLPDVPVVIELWCSRNNFDPVAAMTEYDPEGTAIIVQREKQFTRQAPIEYANPT